MQTWFPRLLLMVLCFAGGCVHRLQLARSDIRPHAGMIVGVCEDYPEETRSLAAARSDLERARLLGASVLRIAFAWDAIEPRRGEYDWAFWDDFVRLADQYGIRLIPYVCYTPRWAADAGDDPRFWRHPPRDPDDFARFMTVLVNRYKHAIHSWELWNEPDNADYFAGSLEQFAAMVRSGSAAVRAADQSAVVVLGGVAWELDFVERLLRDQEISQWVDVVNVHSYFETWSPDPLEFLPQYIGRLREIIRRYGDDQPIWMAEVGYSNYRSGAAVSSAYHAAYAYEHTAEDQARVLFKTLTLLAAEGDVALATWYRLNDLPPAQEVIGDVNNRHLGLYDTHGQPKPAAAALKQWIELLGGAVCIDDITTIRHTIDSDSHVHAFQRRDGELILVGWLQTDIPGNRPISAAGDAQDQRIEHVQFTLPRPGNGPVSVDLPLRGGELYIGLAGSRGMRRIKLLGSAPMAGGARLAPAADAP